MKIAILSLVPGHNYGGIIQSYALKTILEQMGHEVCVITKKSDITPLFSLKKIPRYCVRIVRKLISKKYVSIFAEHENNVKRRMKFQHLLTFCEKKLNLKNIVSFSEILPNEFDAFVVGSDQVWRPKYFTSQFRTSIKNAFLGFACNWSIKRISYAVSFGVDEWEYTPKQTEECEKLISLFDAVSVREVSGVTLCNKYFNIDAIHLCDPTMLLTKEEYESLVVNTPKSKGNLFAYILDENDEKSLLIDKIAQEKNLRPFTVNFKQCVDCSIKESIIPPIESWLRGFMDAEFIVTDSFHGCVFSLLFHKPFVVFGNKERGMSRFDSLLMKFNQEERLIKSVSEYNESKEYNSLDGVDEVLHQLREEAIHYLRQYLS